jgi:hypothetical protein
MPDRQTSLFPIILNSKNYDPVSKKFIFKFPKGSQKLVNAKIGFNSLSLFYSWRNVTEKFNNRKFQLIIPYGATFKELNITLDEGNYTLEQINQYMQREMVKAGCYIVNQTGGFVYFAELVTNAVSYSIELRLYEISTLPAGFSNPAAYQFPPVVSKCTFVVLNNNNFGDLIGFNKGAYMSNHSSDKSPMMSPISSILVGVDLVDNHFSNPSDLIYSFTSNDTKYGSMITRSSDDIVYLNCKNGIFNSLSVTLYDDQYRLLELLDTSAIIYLLLKIYD